MNLRLSPFLAASAALLLTAVPLLGAARERTLLDRGWRFHPGDIPAPEGAASVAFDDRLWREVDVPHDFIIEEAHAPPASNLNPAEARVQKGHAYLPLLPAWYRRRLVIPDSARGRILRLDFDGVFRASEVWLNGRLLGRHAGGYTPFSFNLTGIARAGAENVIAVRVDPRQPEGWWYEGGGIYRHVWLTTLDALHIAQWGTQVATTLRDENADAGVSAELAIETTLENEDRADTTCELRNDVLDADGTVVATARRRDLAAPRGNRIESQHASISRPHLWSLESPYLYRLRTTVLRVGQPVDIITTSFGVRTLRFDPENGFFLNGRHVELQGLALHQDFAGVGIAVPDSLQSWRVAQLKKAGANALRTAHNLPSEALLEACDRLGMLVMEENRHFGETFAPAPGPVVPVGDLAELKEMVRRDRNHPSIIVWSMGNEGGKIQGLPHGADVMAAMREVVRRYDTTRPVTYAMNAGWLADRGIADTEDILGVNYHPEQYDAIHRRHPDRMMFGSEDTNEKTTRGEYADDAKRGVCSAYHLSDEGWQAVASRRFLAGSFTWTAMDYEGEPNPYGWPDVSNNTGLMDRCGFPKDKFYYFQACWSDQPRVHLVPDSWTWPGMEGRPIRVLAFTNAQRVELFLNGRSLGAKEVLRGAHAEWSVPYEPGRLAARALTGGNQVAATRIETADAPARIVLAPDHTRLRANAEDAVVVPVSILDQAGRIVPDAANRVIFQLSGDARIAGVGNGDPANHEPEAAGTDNVRAFHGRCIAVIEAGVHAGRIELTATSPGIPPARMEFESTPEK